MKAGTMDSPHYKAIWETKQGGSSYLSETQILAYRFLIGKAIIC